MKSFITIHVWKRPFRLYTQVIVGVILTLVYIYCFVWNCIYDGVYSVKDVYTLSNHIETLQFFVLELGEKKLEKLPFGLHVGLLLAPTATVTTIILSVSSDLRRWFQRRLTCNHVVICGLGQKGLTLARQLAAKGQSVVIIESDPNHDNLSVAEQLPVQILCGNAQSSEVLKKAGLLRAKHLVIITDDDNVNVSILMHACSLLETARQRDRTDLRPALKTVLHLNDPDMCPSLRRQNVMALVRENTLLKVVNAPEMAARDIFTRKVVEVMPVHDPSTKTDNGQNSAGNVQLMHYIIIGFGRYGQAAALQAAKMTHLVDRDNYSDRDGCIRTGDRSKLGIHKIRITVVDKNPLQLTRFLDAYPAMTGLCQIEDGGDFIRKYLEDHKEAAVLTAIDHGHTRVGDIDVGSINEAVRHFICQSPADGDHPNRYKTAVFFTLGEDYRNLKHALSISGRLCDCRKKLCPGKAAKPCEEIPFYVEMSDSQGLSQLLEREDVRDTYSKRIFGFGQVDELFSAETVLEDTFTTVARCINREYSGTDNWEQLSYELQDSNCQAADHAVVKLRTLGYVPVEITSRSIKHRLSTAHADTSTASPPSHHPYLRRFNHYIDILRQTANHSKSSSYPGLPDINQLLQRVCEDWCEPSPNTGNDAPDPAQAVIQKLARCRRNAWEAPVIRLLDLETGQDPEKTRLALKLEKMEHARWCAEKTLLGYTYSGNRDNTPPPYAHVDRLEPYLIRHAVISEIINAVQADMSTPAKELTSQERLQRTELLDFLTHSLNQVKDQTAKYNIDMVHWDDLHEVERNKDRTQINIICQAYWNAKMFPMTIPLARLHRIASCSGRRHLLEYRSLKYLQGALYDDTEFVRMAKKLCNPHFPSGLESPEVLIVAGDCTAHYTLQQSVGRDLKEKLERFNRRCRRNNRTGLVISGATNVGIPALVGEITNTLKHQNGDAFQCHYKLLGYLPEFAKVPLHPAYSEHLFYTRGAKGFTLMEPFSYWIDLISHKIPADRIRLYYYDGGPITRTERELAAEFGACVEALKG